MLCLLFPTFLYQLLLYQLPPLLVPPRSDPQQTNSKALHRIKTHRFLNQNPPNPPYPPYPQTNGHLLPQNRDRSLSSNRHLPQTTHIQLLQPRNGTPFAVSLIQPMSIDSSIKTHQWSLQSHTNQTHFYFLQLHSHTTLKLSFFSSFLRTPRPKIPTTNPIFTFQLL